MDKMAPTTSFFPQSSLSNFFFVKSLLAWCLQVPGWTTLFRTSHRSPSTGTKQDFSKGGGGQLENLLTKFVFKLLKNICADCSRVVDHYIVIVIFFSYIISFFSILISFHKNTGRQTYGFHLSTRANISFPQILFVMAFLVSLFHTFLTVFQK
jgi:hypothetical protein